MTEEQACEVPLLELMASVPPKSVLRWTDTEGLKASHNVPVGKYLHEAIHVIRELGALQHRKWQPIETIPANALVLIWLPKANMITLARKTKDCWYDEYENADPFFGEITHWMWLPIPPCDDSTSSDATNG